MMSSRQVSNNAKIRSPPSNEGVPSPVPLHRDPSYDWSLDFRNSPTLESKFLHAVPENIRSAATKYQIDLPTEALQWLDSHGGHYEMFADPNLDQIKRWLNTKTICGMSDAEIHSYFEFEKHLHLCDSPRFSCNSRLTPATALNYEKHCRMFWNFLAVIGDYDSMLLLLVPDASRSYCPSVNHQSIISYCNHRYLSAKTPLCNGLSNIPLLDINGKRVLAEGTVNNYHWLKSLFGALSFLHGHRNQEASYREFCQPCHDNFSQGNRNPCPHHGHHLDFSYSGNPIRSVHIKGYISWLERQNQLRGYNPVRRQALLPSDVADIHHYLKGRQYDLQSLKFYVMLLNSLEGAMRYVGFQSVQFSNFEDHSSMWMIYNDVGIEYLVQSVMEKNDQAPQLYKIGFKHRPTGNSSYRYQVTKVMPKNVMLKECLCLQAYLCSQRALPNETNCAWIVASEGTPMTSPTYKMGESDVFDVLDSVAAALNVDNEQNKMLSHVKISETTNASVAAAIRSAAKRCNNRIRLDFSTWEMFIFVCRERTWERLHVSHACLREDTPTVSIKSTVFTEESSVYPVSTNFQEVKEALMEVLNDLPRQYVSVDSEQICRGLQCAGFWGICYQFYDQKKTDTMCMCDDCGTWHLSPDGFVIHESDRFFCNYVRKRCYAPGLDQTALRTVKKAKADTPGPETETEVFVRPLKSLAESSQYFRGTNFELGADDNVQEEGKRDTLTLLPKDVLGSNLICRSQSTTFTNQCPWCGKYFQPWKGEKVDLLSDLPDITLELRRDLVSHERGNKCIFWGLRINRSVKNVPVTTEPTIRLSILKSIVSVLGYGKSKSGTERRCITIDDCATKEQFLQKIEKIFSEAERFLHSSKTNPGSLDASSPRLVFFSFEYAKATVIRGTGTKARLWRRLTTYYLGQIHQAIVARVISWPGETWNEDRVRLASDANLSLFNYYYFWYCSIFYSSAYVDMLIPIRDTGMELLYKKQKNPTVPIMKGLFKDYERGAQKLFSLPHVQRAATHNNEGILMRNGVPYIVPIHVVHQFPYWLHGWECLECGGETVVSVANHCLECKKVVCYSCVQKQKGGGFRNDTCCETGSVEYLCTSCSGANRQENDETEKGGKESQATFKEDTMERTSDTTVRKGPPYLLCEECTLLHQPVRLLTLDQSFRAKVLHPEKWWETEFVATFCAMLAHSIHHNEVLYVHCLFSKNLEERATASLPGHVKTVISVVHGRGHFVVLEVNVEKRVIEVWDGKDYNVTTWTETISYLLRKIRLLNFDCKPTFKDGRDKRVQLSMWVRGIKEWTVTRTRMLKQDDDYNCGPIACLRVWETLVPGDVDVGQLSPNDYRGVIVRKFDQLFGELKNNLIWGNEELEEATYTRTKRTIRSEITEIMD
ncbi:hypothetical protein IV203_037973 [Nitzschia inconspicua]|uniref:Ubiquitin-like protease family profile domain-containing protein n=1 Tax=Nitzschia inconspicua TaxID=303405 RepID=A0A9K3LQH5_9STRA|nr:hypothetical protein IV203_037973 [Nitzschia inconspicua]